MERLSWDTETALFGQGRMAPPLSCLSYKQGRELGLIDHIDTLEFMTEKLSDPNILHVGHHIAYDMAVIAAEHPELLPLIFKAYRENRVTDTGIRTMILDNAVGKLGGYWRRFRNKSGDWDEQFVQTNYSLDACHYRARKERLEKDEWRLKYGELRGVPLKDWPDGAKLYPLNDARATDVVFEWTESYSKQVVAAYKGIKKGHIKDPEPLADEYRQARAAFWMQLMSVWGIRTDPNRVDAVEAFIHKELQILRERLMAVGLVRADGSRDTQVAQERMRVTMERQNKECRLTKKKRISLKEEFCRASGDVYLQDYAEITSLGNVLSKDLPALREGKILPIHSSFWSFKATGRTSSSNPNIQNIRRLPGIRECFVPREGKVFLDCDYDGLELRTLAQVCLRLLGKSRLAELLNEGKDPHLMFAAEMLGISYKEAIRRKKNKDPEIKEMRQLAKAANFGYPGGLGAQTFVAFARGYDVFISEEKAKDLKEKWLKTFPEMKDYFALISQYCNEDPEEGLANVEQLFSKRLRGGMTYPQACNTYFQGLGADATKEAGFQIAYECYVDMTSPLFGCRIVNYIHDQFLVECDEDKAHDAAIRLARVMESSANKFLPDVPAIVSEPMVCRFWSKNAEQAWDRKPWLEDGTLDPEARLIPWSETFEVKKRESH